MKSLLKTVKEGIGATRPSPGTNPVVPIVSALALTSQVLNMRNVEITQSLLSNDAHYQNIEKVFLATAQIGIEKFNTKPDPTYVIKSNSQHTYNLLFP